MTFVDDNNGRSNLAALAAQVTAIDRDYQDLKRAVASLDSKIETSHTALSNRFEASMSGLTAKLDSKTQTPWHTIWSGLGVVFLALTTLGGALYWPIQRDTNRLDSIMAVVLDKGVFSKQYDADQVRTTDILRSLRADVNITIQQQRYNADQERLSNTLDTMRKNIAGKDYVETAFAERSIVMADTKKHSEETAKLVAGLTAQVTRLEEGYKINEKNLDILFKRNYDLATEVNKLKH